MCACNQADGLDDGYTHKYSHCNHDEEIKKLKKKVKELERKLSEKEVKR